MTLILSNDDARELLVMCGNMGAHVAGRGHKLPMDWFTEDVIP